MNKREQQRLIREQKQQAAERKQKLQKNLTRAALVILVPLVLIGVLYGFLGQGEVYAPDQVGAADHVKGNPDAPITMVVYADFQCPACATEHRVMAQAWPRIAERVQLVFRHYPLTSTHQHAWSAALYAEAAGAQGKFWEMYDLLFLNQAYWSTLIDVESEFDGYLEQLDLDVEQAHQDMASDVLAQKVRNDQRGGTRAGVRSTPALFVNGRQNPVPQNPIDMIALVNRHSES
ncbi:DsbA family protein [Pseudohongiella spirulinae]|uniref:DSBA oxidoreductase n=1 Tax=Pseudohongiella spirulinae TaxID=1249552 RepID=A0A0S2KC28_9GAMM|nr:DsbA family protein [Pseudohongiella spirulinae]ALO45884.1 DSBA oxidoreductase [Pseudohongiella spirulinae]